MTAKYGATPKEAYENGTAESLSEARNYLWNAIATLSNALDNSYLDYPARIALHTLIQWRDEE